MIRVNGSALNGVALLVLLVLLCLFVVLNCSPSLVAPLTGSWVDSVGVCQAVPTSRPDVARCQ